jgi:hypothetical protein
MNLARAFLTAILLGGAGLSFILDWSSNHLLNPEWHPHARFHGGLLLFMLAGVSLTGTWLMWRKSKEPQVALTAAALLALSFWTPLLYVGSVVPGATPWAGPAGSQPHIGGAVFYPNLAVAAVFVLLTVGAWWLGNAGRPKWSDKNSTSIN